MQFRSPQGQNDFLEAATLQKLIIAAMREITEKRPQELATSLRQIFDRHNASNSYVRAEVAELIQELKNLIGDFDPSPLHDVSYTPIHSKSRFTVAALAFAGSTAIVILGAIGFEFVRQSTTITPSQSPAFSDENLTACIAVNPDRVAVKGHHRNGSYVKSHERTAPNHTKADNFNCPR